MVSPTCLEADELAGEWSRSGKPRAAAAPPRAGSFQAPDGRSRGSRLWEQHQLVSKKGKKTTSPDPVPKEIL